MRPEPDPAAGPFTPTDVRAQYGAARNDRLRILIIGAGVAGLSLAQLLRGRGLHPVLIERADHERNLEGYMLGLMPFVDPTVAELGVESDYLARSTGMTRYTLRGAKVQFLKRYDFEAVADYGHYRGIERPTLMRVLAGENAAVAYGATVAGLEGATASGADAGDRAVEVEFREHAGTHRLDFDAVVIADGLHSSTRALVLAESEIRFHDTGWGGWLVWDDDTTDADTDVETWGAGWFLGFYPVPGRTGVFLGAPRAQTARGPAALASTVRDRIAAVDDRTSRALETFSAADNPFFWTFSDVRCDRWAVGPTVLLGDAAAGFLPTAGVGASMAMESARVLAPNLVDAVDSATDAIDVQAVFRDFEASQRPRVEKAQQNSRNLADLMFRGGGVLTAARDVAARFMGVKTALGPTLSLLDTRPPPPG